MMLQSKIKNSVFNYLIFRGNPNQHSCLILKGVKKLKLIYNLKLPMLSYWLILHQMIQKRL